MLIEGCYSNLDLQAFSEYIGRAHVCINNEIVDEYLYLFKDGNCMV